MSTGGGGGGVCVCVPYIDNIWDVKNIIGDVKKRFLRVLVMRISSM